MTTSWTWPSRGVATAPATAAATVSGRKNRRVVLAALERDQFTLHIGVGAAWKYRGHPKLRLVVAQESANARNANLLAE